MGINNSALFTPKFPDISKYQNNVTHMNDF